MNAFAKVIIVLNCLSALSGETISDSDPIVYIRNGKIRGRDHGHYLSFESIPYAEPPIGSNRFENPIAYSENWSGIRDATHPPVQCMQWDQYLFREDLLAGEEDCLTVNVYTPSVTSNQSYPVLVLIHGGAFMFGTALSNGHDYIMSSGNAVVVKMNYRLGPLGFLSTEDEVIPGNLGLKDQLLALEWTKANVAAFNGDPTKITLLGFSAGGSAVHLQMLNKNLEKLAASAISFSGTAFCPWAIIRNPRKRTLALAEHLNCPTENSAAIKTCLKEKDATDIVRAVKYFQKFGYNPFTVFGPVIEPKTVENAFLTEEPEDIIRKGNSAEIQWLASFSKDDGGYNAAELMRKDANGRELIEILNERWNELAPVNLFYENTVDEDKLEKYSNDLRQRYMGKENFSSQTYHLLQKMYTDVLFADGVIKALQLHKKYTQSPVYAYAFDNPSPYGIGQILSQRSDIDFGTVHGDDFFLLFKGKASDIQSKSSKVLSNNFVKMVEDFSLTGNLHFGACKFHENNSSTKGLLVMQITKDSCETVDILNFKSTLNDHRISRTEL